MRVFNKKGDIEWDTLIPYIIGFAVLIFALIWYSIIHKGGGDIINYLKDILRK